MPGTLIFRRVTSREEAIGASPLPFSSTSASSTSASSTPARRLAILGIWQLVALITATLAASTTMVSPVHATNLDKPTGEILLTISGKISNTNHPDGAVFDLEMLEALEPTTIETKTPWTEGVTKFTGVTLKHLFEIIGAKPDIVKMKAEDGYIYQLERKIDDKYPVIVAYKKNDDYMSLRQLGPLWVIFPFDDFPELDTEENRAASVWQLNYMDIQ